MKKKITDKDKKAWEEFVNSKEKIPDKDQQSIKKNFPYIKKTIDLHGYTLQDANIEIEKFILLCFEKGITKINIITGKGSRSKNLDDPYQSKDLSILKYSVPEYIQNNLELMKKIIEIKDAELEDGGSGAFYVFLKKKL